jgi:hypothetical protein
LTAAIRSADDYELQPGWIKFVEQHLSGFAGAPFYLQIAHTMLGALIKSITRARSSASPRISS